MDALEKFLDSILEQVPNFIYAIVLLIIAFIAAKIVKSLVTKLLKAVKAEAFLSKLGVKDTATNSSIEFVAKLAYFVTFLLFLPGVLDKIGMQSVSSPITNMVDSFLGFIPKLVSAGIIVAVGIFVANIVKELLVPVLKALKVDSLQEKAGIAAAETTTFSSVIANAVYGLIILVVVTSALDKLEIAAISGPANDIVATIFSVIPDLLLAIIIIALGIFIAKLVATLLQSLLASVGADSLIEKVTGNASNKVSLSKLISSVVQYVLVIMFLVQGINVLKLPVLTGVGSSIIGYMPAVLSVVLIVAIGVFAANTAETAIAKKFPEAKAGALATKVAIYVLVGFLSLSQLGVATAMVETTFILIIAAICVAFAIAFGVGGRTFAANTLDKVEKKIENKETEN
ncbi:MAG: mechanosensitive ion channel [Lachnospiraceae bacterium]|nr:mechanosensitive ion channel [Lachnospiraceae bacterium]